MGQFRHHHSGKTRTMALFWLRTSYHAQRYMLRSLLTQSFNIASIRVVVSVQTDFSVRTFFSSSGRFGPN